MENYVSFSFNFCLRWAELEFTAAVTVRYINIIVSNHLFTFNGELKQTFYIQNLINSLYTLFRRFEPNGTII